MGDTLLEKAESKLLPEPNTGCWLWIGTVASNGYGKLHTRIKGKQKMLSAHRFMYEQSKGRIPEGKQIDHVCKNKRCVNPSHLEAVTAHENVKRSGAWEHNRSKTHCPKGHAYSAENTNVTISRDGRSCRHCRTCGRELKRNTRV